MTGPRSTTPLSVSNSYITINSTGAPIQIHRKHQIYITGPQPNHQYYEHPHLPLYIYIRPHRWEAVRLLLQMFEATSEVRAKFVNPVKFSYNRPIVMKNMHCLVPR